MRSAHGNDTLDGTSCQWELFGVLFLVGEHLYLHILSGACDIWDVRWILFRLDVFLQVQQHHHFYCGIAKLQVGVLRILYLRRVTRLGLDLAVTQLVCEFIIIIITSVSTGYELGSRHHCVLLSPIPLVTLSLYRSSSSLIPTRLTRRRDLQNGLILRLILSQPIWHREAPGSQLPHVVLPMQNATLGKRDLVRRLTRPSQESR